MSASRTKAAVRSTSVYRATVSIRVPVSAAMSRTAWMSRMAASPRLTMAMRLNTRPSPSVDQWNNGVRAAAHRPRQCSTFPYTGWRCHVVDSPRYLPPFCGKQLKNPPRRTARRARPQDTGVSERVDAVHQPGPADVGDGEAGGGVPGLAGVGQVHGGGLAVLGHLHPVHPGGGVGGGEGLTEGR